MNTSPAKLFFRIITIVTLVAVSAGCTPATPAVKAPQASTQAPSPTPAITTFDADRALQDVVTQVNFGPRVPDSAAHQKQIDWMIAELKAAGWQVETQDTTWKGKPVHNVVAKLGSGHPWMLLGAHFDSRLAANMDPDLAKRDQPVPAANDGASGVAVLLGIARAFPYHQAGQGPEGASRVRQVTLLFIDSEDQGDLVGWDWLLGSETYADTFKTAADKPDAAVILDMIGDANLNIYRELNSDQALTDEIWQRAAELDYNQWFIDRPKYRMIDDHIPFRDVGIRAVDVIDFDYPAWHTTEDTADKVSAHSLQVVGETILSWLLK